jgi:hypothetical protein
MRLCRDQRYQERAYDVGGHVEISSTVLQNLVYFRVSSP